MLFQAFVLTLSKGSTTRHSSAMAQSQRAPRVQLQHYRACLRWRSNMEREEGHWLHSPTSRLRPRNLCSPEPKDSIWTMSPLFWWDDKLLFVETCMTISNCSVNLRHGSALLNKSLVKENKKGKRKTAARDMGVTRKIIFFGNLWKSLNVSQVPSDLKSCIKKVVIDAWASHEPWLWKKWCNAHDERRSGTFYEYSDMILFCIKIYIYIWKNPKTNDAVFKKKM